MTEKERYVTHTTGAFLDAVRQLACAECGSLVADTDAHDRWHADFIRRDECDERVDDAILDAMERAE